MSSHDLYSVVSVAEVNPLDWSRASHRGPQRLFNSLAKFGVSASPSGHARVLTMAISLSFGRLMFSTRVPHTMLSRIYADEHWMRVIPRDRLGYETGKGGSVDREASSIACHPYFYCAHEATLSFPLLS